MMLYNLFEDPFTDRLKGDPKAVKMLYIAMKHDNTLPSKVFGFLGVNPTPDRVIDVWGKLLNAVNKTPGGQPISPDNKFYGWVTQVYTNGGVNWENLISRGRENLESFYMLLRRNILKPNHQNLNFPSLSALESAMSVYRDKIMQYKEEARINELTKDAKSVTIVDNDKWGVVVPLNYGASCKFARSVGDFANWCTGSISSGDNYFNQYGSRGPLIIFQDKNDPNGKYQLHAPTDQFKDKKDHEIDRKAFAQRYPTAMNDIVAGMQQHAEEINTGKYKFNMVDQIALVKSKFKTAFGAANAVEPHPDYGPRPNPQEVNDEDF